MDAPHFEPGDASLIRLTSISKAYSLASGAVHALREVDLTIAPGEFVAIIGASGSGKSTLMNVLGCLDEPTSGSYVIAGVEAARLSTIERAIVRNRMIGFVFQGFNLIPTSSALENCELPLQYRSFPREHRRAAARQALESVGLEDRLHHYPNQLSGGQQQRVAIARALVTNPPLLLADEPTGNLDTRASYGVLALLQHLNRSKGVTVVLVTHEPDVAACASRVVAMRDGRIVRDTYSSAPRSAEVELRALSRDTAADASFDPPPNPRSRRRIDRTFSYWMLMGAAIGGSLGAVYSLLAVGQWVPWLAALGALVGDCWLGAVIASRKLNRRLDDGERTTLAFYATAAATFLFVPVLFLVRPSEYLPRTFLHDLNAARGLAVIACAAALVYATWLVHYLLLGLLTPSEADARD